MNYTTEHVVGQMQLLLFALLAFVFLYRAGLHPPELRSINLDFDWTYRRAGPAIIWYFDIVVRAIYRGVTGWVLSVLAAIISKMHSSAGPDGARALKWPVGAMVLNVAILLGVALVVIFVI